MVIRKSLAIGLLSIALLAGCGGRNDGVGVDPGNDTTTITDPAPTMPTDPGLPSTPVAPAPVQLQAVSATIANKDKFGGFLFWFKKIEAEIAVTNPNPVQTSATLTITFSKKGQSVETLTQTVDLAPGENKTIEVKATKTCDDVSVYATNDTPTTPAAGAPPTGGFAGGTGSSPY